MEKKMNYLDAAEKALEQMKFHYTKQETSRGPVYEIPMSSKNLPGLDLRLRVSEKGDSKLWCYPVKNVPSGKRIAMLEALNTQMDSYRFVTLTLDGDNDVCASYDFALFGEAEAIRHIRVMINLFSDVVDECLPGILKVLWSDDAAEEPELKFDLFGDEDEEE